MAAELRVLLIIQLYNKTTPTGVVLFKVVEAAGVEPVVCRMDKGLTG